MRRAFNEVYARLSRNIRSLSHFSLRHWHLLLRSGLLRTTKIFESEDLLYHFLLLVQYI